MPLRTAGTVQTSGWTGDVNRDGRYLVSSGSESRQQPSRRFVPYEWEPDEHQEGRDMAMKPERVGSRVPGSATGAGHPAPRTLIVWRVLSALLLLTMGGIHLYLALKGAGSLGKPFWVNAVGGLVLAVAILVLRGRLLLLASALATLFMAGTLLALVLALTVGLFGIHEFLSYDPVPPTLVVESIGTIVLAVTTALLYQAMRGRLTRSRAV